MDFLWLQLRPVLKVILLYVPFLFYFFSFHFIRFLNGTKEWIWVCLISMGGVRTLGWGGVGSRGTAPPPQSSTHHSNEPNYPNYPHVEVPDLKVGALEEGGGRKQGGEGGYIRTGKNR